MKRAWRWWLVFAACNVLVVVALVRISSVVVNLERSELQARAERDDQESLRLAMWRMDSWLSLFLAREAAQPIVAEPSNAPGRAALPSSGPDSELVLVRFSVDARGPDVSSETAVDSYRLYLRPEVLSGALARADDLITADSPAPALPASPAELTEFQQSKSKNEFDARVACAVPGSESARRQVVAWLDITKGHQDESALAFIRRVDSGGLERYEGFLLDWPKLHDRLLTEIRDLFPTAKLERTSTVAASDSALGRTLANLPVALITPPPAVPAAVGITAGKAALALAWLAAIGAMIAVGITLHKSIDLGERRRRFASAVTHELRTPLTTFQLYSEMLAEGVVKTDEQRQVYLKTLKEESQRLSAMVSNVLDHARLEERSGPRPVESLSLDSLVERVRGPLERRAASAGMALDVETERSAATLLEVDADAIGQILANLVDNAAKYAAGGVPKTIALHAAVPNGSLVMTVSDYGPGVPARQARAIFAPFERGGRDSADPIPGIGLGLALSRGLARDMGGDLTLDPHNGGGATFRLTVPAQRPR